MIAYENMTMITHMIAFFIVSDGTFHPLNTLSIYLYHAYIMNQVHTTNHN